MQTALVQISWEVLRASRSLSLGALSCWCESMPMNGPSSSWQSVPLLQGTASDKAMTRVVCGRWFPFIAFSRSSPCIGSHLSRPLRRVRQVLNPVLQAWPDQRGRKWALPRLYLLSTERFTATSSRCGWREGVCVCPCMCDEQR